MKTLYRLMLAVLLAAVPATAFAQGRGVRKRTPARTVGHPVVVNPDPVLYRTAVRRRWPVRIFEQPARSTAS